MLTTTYNSPVGILTLAAEKDTLIGLWLAGQKYFGQGIPGSVDAAAHGEAPAFDAARAWLARYFAGEQPSPHELRLAPMGSDFRQKIWRILCGIPYGETTTYGGIARRIGCKSAQAVGGAVGHNPISIIIPCHRVVGTGGALTGYAGGLEAKKFLLAHEGD